MSPDLSFFIFFTPSVPRRSVPFGGAVRFTLAFTFCTSGSAQLQRRLCGLQVQRRMMDVPLLYLHLLCSLMGHMNAWVD